MVQWVELIYLERHETRNKNLVRVCNLEGAHEAGRRKGCILKPKTVREKLNLDQATGGLTAL